MAYLAYQVSAVERFRLRVRRWLRIALACSSFCVPALYYFTSSPSDPAPDRLVVAIVIGVPAGFIFAVLISFARFVIGF
jgi:hypothetical protein